MALITLGINAAFHDSAAALVIDGVTVAAAEEERFTRIKHGKRPVPFSAWELPFHAIDYCLATTSATASTLARSSATASTRPRPPSSCRSSRRRIARASGKTRGTRSSRRTSSTRRDSCSTARPTTCASGCRRRKRMPATAGTT